MSERSAHLQLPYLAQGQAQKHVTVNEAFARLDAVAQLAVQSAQTDAQPASPDDGDRYILPSGKTGDAWGAMANGAVAYYHDGAWEEIAPRAGWRAYAADTGESLVFDGTDWSLPLASVVATAAADTVIGRASSGSGPLEAIGFSASARALCDDASFAAMCATLGAWRVLAASAAPVSLTGSTGETTLASITIPAGAMGPNGAVRVTSLWSLTNSANTKTARYRFGGAALMQIALTTTRTTLQQRLIQNRNAVDSQVSHADQFANSFGGSSLVAATAAVDTGADVTLALTGQLTNSGETMTLESYLVELFYGA